MAFFSFLFFLQTLWEIRSAWDVVALAIFLSLFSFLHTLFFSVSLLTRVRIQRAYKRDNSSRPIRPTSRSCVPPRILYVRLIFP